MTMLLGLVGFSILCMFLYLLASGAREEDKEFHPPEERE